MFNKKITILLIFCVFIFGTFSAVAMENTNNIDQLDAASSNDLGYTIVPSPVFDEADNFDVWKTNSIWQINAMNYSGFYYDIHDDVYGETLTIYESNTMGQRTLGESSLVYETSIIDGIAPEFAFSLQGAPSTYFSYSILGFMGERYVPITNNVSTVSKLLIDDDDSYTLRVGESLELGEGYAVTPQQIDVDGAQVWLELTKDGEYVDDKVINIAYANTHDRTWYFDQNIGNKEDVTTLMIHVDEVFQGQVDSLCVIEGIWQISGNPMQFNIDDAHGLFTVTKCTETLQMELSDPLYLEKGKTYDILPSSEGDLAISVADSTSLRFNFVKEAYDDFQQQIRGSVVEVGSESETITWSTTGNNSFMGLWYDLDSVQTSEKITVKEINNYERVIEEGNLIYTSTKSPNIDPAFNFTDFTSTYDKFQYDVIGVEGKAYVPITEDNVSTMSKLLLDTSSSYTLRTGESLELREGYGLTPKQIDVEGNKVWLELTKNGDFVDDKVISTDGTNSESKTWYFEQDVGGNDNVLTLMVHVDELFQGQIDSLCVIDGVWQISDSPIVIEEGNVFGNLVVSNQTNDVIEMKNEDEIYLDEDEIVDVFGGIKFNIADDPTSLRFCPTMTSSLSNNPPECFIDMIYPDPVLENTSIIFKGHATDFDGFIVGYRWESNIDGLLSNEKCFTDSSLSPGNHTISFKVQDEDGVWSNERLIKLSVFTESQAEENLSSVFDKADNFDVWNTDSSWYLNASDFDGFYRDEYDDLSGESFTVYENKTVGSRTLGEGSLSYETVVMSGIEPYFPFTTYYDNTPFTYQKIALFGDAYLPIYEDPSTLSKLLIDDDKTYSVAIGESLELAEGYAITPQQIDVDGTKVWIVLTKNGEFVDDKIIDTAYATTNEKTWYFEQDIGDADDVTTIMVHVDDLFQTQNNGTCIINGIWQISDKLLHLDVDDKFGKMEINSVSHDGIEMELDESVTLNASQTYSLAGNIGLKVADDEELLRFRFVKYNPSNISNTLPTSIIDSITPNPANESEIVTFQGSGVDIDGNIVDYYWNSSIDGQLSTSANFSTSSLSPGTHTIYFSVQDDDGAWSNPVSTSLVVEVGSTTFMAESLGFSNTTGIENSTVSIPLEICNVSNGPLQTLTCDIQYNDSVLLLESATTGSLTSGWIASTGTNNHSITLSTSDSSNAIVNGSSGDVCNLQFKVIGQPEDSTEIYPDNIDFSNTVNMHGTAPSKSGIFTVESTGRLSGTAAYKFNGTGIGNVDISLLESGNLITTTTTDLSGNYKFADIEPGTYMVRLEKPGFYVEEITVEVSAGSEIDNDISMSIIGDLDDNGSPADAVDVNMMMQASVGDLEANRYFDLDNNSEFADAVDVNMMMQASVGDLVLE